MHFLDFAKQRVVALDGTTLRHLDLPSANMTVVGHDVRWGDFQVPMTPAYWAAQSWMWELAAPAHFKLGRNLAEELLACMLGGYGIPAEVGLAAYQRLRAVMQSNPDAMHDRGAVYALLAEPLLVAGRLVRYRFAAQKADRIAAAFSSIMDIDPSIGDVELRDRLTQLKGVGPKTASWVLRNLRGSDEVAILDIHILRAGAALGMFEDGHRVERHYREMERSYLNFAKAIRTRASFLDSVIWMTMRQIVSPAPRAQAGRKALPNSQMALGT